jgi:hypothetical protein
MICDFASVIRTVAICLLAAAISSCGVQPTPRIQFGVDGCDLLPMQRAQSGYTVVGVRRSYVGDLHSLSSMTPVLYVPVTFDGETMRDIKQMWLWGEGTVQQRATCRTGSNSLFGPVIQCSSVIPGTSLGLNVLFDPSVHDANARIDQLAQRISRDVLCRSSARG